MDLQALQNECLNCRRCALCDTRTHVVFGQGVPTAEVMFVGEGPGASEDEQGQPFVGRSGQLLDHYLEAVDLSREKNVYIANIIKCRPPQNRDPLPEESAACMRCVSGPRGCTADDGPGLFNLPRSRQILRKAGNPIYGNLPPCSAAALSCQQACSVRRFCQPAGKDHTGL